MLDGATVVKALKECGVSHVVWIPDSATGRWDEALRSDPDIRLIRVTREGEAIGVAMGLLIGGQRPAVVIQCTGLFEAGDSLRNAVHDLKLPLFLMIGLRGYHAYQRGERTDTCPVFAEPILRAWQIGYRILDDGATGSELITAYRECERTGRAFAVFIAE